VLAGLLRCLWIFYDQKQDPRKFQKGWTGALDPESVISKLDVQLRTPTLINEEASLPDPWVSKTPKTVAKVNSQSEYIKRQIRQH
jgi:hypothetical protein